MKRILILTSAIAYLTGCNQPTQPTDPVDEQTKMCTLGVGHMEDTLYVRDSVITVDCASLPPRMGAE